MAESFPVSVGVETGGFGVYVHVPFCAARCDYCDFATWTDRAHLVADYVDACIADVRGRAESGALRPATSVFFGGGTPSLLRASDLVAILDAVPRTVDAEVTVECNPDSVDRAKLDRYLAHGVTRISLGVQSLVPGVLRSLGRTHDPDNVRRAVDALREAGFTTFNVDLIYGAEGESRDDWEYSVDAALALGAPHVSAYALTVEPGTALADRVGAGEAAAPDEDDQVRKYAVADEAFARAGLEWYEISNWARPGHECRHNLLYWRGGEYVGIGAAAHGFTGGRRWWNVRTPERYVAAIRQGRSAVAGSEEPDAGQRLLERLMLGLRTRDGVTLDARAPDAVLGRLAEEGLVEHARGRAVLTRRGRMVANEVVLRLAAGAAPPP